MSKKLSPHRNPKKQDFSLKVGLAEMLKGGVIMDVTTPEQAKIAEESGAVAVMALERIPADIRKEGGIARMADPEVILRIQEAVSIPVMAKCRIGHSVEAQILESLQVDFIDESEVLTPADGENHVDKRSFIVPFVCGCRNLGEALRRIAEGAALIRSKGEAGTGNIIEAVGHLRSVMRDIYLLQRLPREELFSQAKKLQAPLSLLEQVAAEGKLPVPLFSAGGVVTPADAALMRQLGAESIFVGSGIFASDHSEKRAKAIVQATVSYDNPQVLAEISQSLGKGMKGTYFDYREETGHSPAQERFSTRGW